MAHPKMGYWIDGKRVPSVTTVIGRFKESGGLVHWAWDLGMQGIDYRDVRDTAADLGTLVHDIAEGWLKGSDIPYDIEMEFGLCADDAEMVANAMWAFIEWEKQTDMELIETECQLVSGTYGFGGTPDAVARINGKICLLDWKTSNRVYKDYKIQLAAYGKLLEENRDYQIEGGYHLVRFDKGDGSFQHHWWPNLDKEWEVFLKMLDLYNDLKKISTGDGQ